MRIMKVNNRTRKVVASNDITSVMDSISADPEQKKIIADYLKQLGNDAIIMLPAKWFFILKAFADGVDLSVPYRSPLFRRYILDIMDKIISKAISFVRDGDDDNLFTYLMPFMSEIEKVFSTGKFLNLPEFESALRNGYAAMKQIIPADKKPDIAMALWRKSGSLIPQEIKGQYPGLQRKISQMLIEMVPSGTDSLHAMMYIQKKVKTIKDVHGELDRELGGVPPLRDRMFRYWLNEDLGLYVDLGVRSLPPTITDRTNLEGCTATVSCSLGSIQLPLHRREGDRINYTSFPQGGNEWFKAFSDGAVTVHVDQWNMDLDFGGRGY